MNKMSPENKDKLREVAKYLNFDNLINYYSHLLYMPTYLTGPIISFNHYLY